MRCEEFSLLPLVTFGRGQFCSLHPSGQWLAFSSLGNASGPLQRAMQGLLPEGGHECILRTPVRLGLSAVHSNVRPLAQVTFQNSGKEGDGSFDQEKLVLCVSHTSTWVC